MKSGSVIHCVIGLRTRGIGRITRFSARSASLTKQQLDKKRRPTLVAALARAARLPWMSIRRTRPSYASAACRAGHMNCQVVDG
jgi:hypothetical protein